MTVNGSSGRPSVKGITIDEILARWGGGAPIDLLKIDIEGAEKEVFSAPLRFVAGPNAADRY
ncbi:MAG: FkbM family methyltransferase [Candidatus Binataceae bacterium]